VPMQLLLSRKADHRFSQLPVLTSAD